MTTDLPPGIDPHPLTGGRWDVRCGKCLRTSVPVPATSLSSVWDQLLAIGWIHYVSQYGGQGYALCPQCATEPTAPPKKQARRKHR